MDVLTIQWGFVGGKKKIRVIPPTPPTPIIQVVEEHRWPGPPITLYRETDIIPAWQRQREDEEMMIL